jgi:hypothetical protein
MEVLKKKTKKLNINLPYDSVIPLLDNFLKEYKPGYIEPLAHPCLFQQYSPYPSFGNSPDALQLMNRLRKCDMYTQWSIIQS